MAKGIDLLKVVGLVGIGLVAVMAGPKVIRRVKASKGKLSGIFDSGAQFVDHVVAYLTAAVSIRPKAETMLRLRE